MQPGVAMPRTFGRVVVILLSGAALGVVVNAVSPRRIPWITPLPPKLTTEDTVSLDEVKTLWQTGGAIFLDARSPSDYAAGHIPNSLNLPAEQFEEHYPQVAAMLTPDTRVVVYCDGVECELSHHLADRLRSLNYKRVRILVNGWTTWRTAGLPTQTGDAP
jgi:rhodanese-related sulfurtransferase